MIDDTTTPRLVEWLCRPCHLALHGKKAYDENGVQLPAASYVETRGTL